MICMKRALTDGVSNMSSTWQYRQMSITCTAYQSQNTILAYSHLQMITGVLLAFLVFCFQSTILVTLQYLTFASYVLFW